MESLRITEIFFSLQGEARTVGLPTVFVRLTGCPLRCHYCDTAYAFHGGQMMPLPEIIAAVMAKGAKYVTVTGGEPLAQPNCAVLLEMLCERGLQVSLETSGAMDISNLDPRVSIVLDLKTPGSGEVARNLYTNLAHLKPIDQVKFVICNRQDYEWANFKLQEYSLADRVSDVLYSASHEELEARDLAEWIIGDCLPVRLQIQLHKYLWGDRQGV